MFNDFYDDPFFGFGEHHHRRRHVDQIEDSGSHRHSGRRRLTHNGSRDLATLDQFDQSFRDPFSMFDSVMSNMRNMMNGGFSESFNLDNKDGFGYSSVHVSSYADDGSGQPKVFQASKSTKVAPGGLKETHKALRDTEAGLEKMAIGRHIRDRGHLITRERNTRSGDINENQDFIGFGEEEADEFDQEWKRETKAFGGNSKHFLREERSRRVPKLEHKSGHKSKY